jgi:hypothetical protein
MTDITLEQWQHGIRLEQMSHARAAARYESLHKSLGLTVTIISVIVGTSTFSALSSGKNQLVLVMVGAISVVAAVLSGMQTFLNFGQLAADHQSAANDYGKIRRHIDEILSDNQTPVDLHASIKAIREEWDQLEDKVPTVPQKLHDAAQRIIEKQGH